MSLYSGELESGELVADDTVSVVSMLLCDWTPGGRDPPSPPIAAPPGGRRADLKQRRVNETG